ncbi:MAG: citramalate synthase, partial [Actinomycetes bacterium]
LNMIQDTISYLVSQGRTVFLDAEHFFDGYHSNKNYALEVVKTAMQAGAELVALCDTNGGMLPDQLGQVVHDVLNATNARIGIHCHDDTNCAVANTLSAVDAGATHVQGTANGYGERSGNANLFSVVANLQLKKGKVVVPSDAIKEMTRIAHAVSEITNINPNQHQPYVGFSAFAHKAGLHASAVKIDPMLYQHIDPNLVGNDMRTLVSDMAGRASIELKGKEIGIDLTGNKEVLTNVVEKVKDMESRGYTFEAADASFELLLRDELGENTSKYFTVESWKVTVEQAQDGKVSTDATVKVLANGQRILQTSEGNGPVNALDKALRAALEKIYPEIGNLELIDYKVRILEGVKGTGAVTRVLIETSDGNNQWDTVGVHENVIAASWNAISDAVTYGLLKSHVK